LRTKYQASFVESILYKEIPHLGASVELAQASACAATKKKFAFSCIRYVEVK